MKTSLGLKLAIVISLLMIFSPPLIYHGVILPYAETTRDPDAIEALWWIVGLGTIFLGILGLFACFVIFQFRCINKVV